MTSDLFRALIGRLVAVVAAAVVLGGLAGHASATRPEAAAPLAVKMVCFDPGAPEAGWVRCADGV